MNDDLVKLEYVEKEGLLKTQQKKFMEYLTSH